MTKHQTIGNVINGEGPWYVVLALLRFGKIRRVLGDSDKRVHYLRESQSEPARPYRGPPGGVA